MATGGVRALVLAVLLEDERGALRADPVELLLLRDEMHLGLRLHGEAHLGRGKDLLLLLGGQSWRHPLELEGGLLDRSDEREAMILVTGRHRRRWVHSLVASAGDHGRVLHCIALS